MEQVFSEGMSEKILHDIVPTCVHNKWCLTSSLKMQQHFGEGKEAKLGMSLLETAAVVDASMPFLRACYQLEGDSPLILTAHSVFEKIEMHIRSGFTLCLVRNCATKAHELIIKRETVWINNLLDLDSELNLAKKKVQECEDKLSKFENKKPNYCLMEQVQGAGIVEQPHAQLIKMMSYRLKRRFLL